MEGAGKTDSPARRSILSEVQDPDETCISAMSQGPQGNETMKDTWHKFLLVDRKIIGYAWINGQIDQQTFL